MENGSQSARALLPVLVGLTFVTAVISSLGAPLLPDIARSLDVSLSSAQWSLTAALVASAVAAPILGRLGDGRHSRGALLGTLVAVSVGGIVAASTSSLALLVVGRALQGVGLGSVPLMMAIARANLPAAKVTAAVGLLSVSGAAGVGAGYPLSGLVANEFGVDAAFLFGTLISGVGLIAAYVAVPASRTERAVSLDLAGALIGGAGTVALLIGIAQGEVWGWASPATLGVFATAAATLGAWVVHQRRVASPLVDLRQLGNPAVRGADLAAFLIGVTLYIFVTVVTEFVQAPVEGGFGFGGSTLVAGLCLVPFSALSLGASRAMNGIVRRRGTRVVLLMGCSAIAAAGVFFALVHSALWQSFVTNGLLGVGFGFTFAALPGVIVASVPGHEAGSAMGFYQVVRSVGFSIGSALVAGVLSAYELAGGQAGEDGFLISVWIGVGSCLLAMIVIAFASAGAEAMAPVELADERS